MGTTAILALLEVAIPAAMTLIAALIKMANDSRAAGTLTEEQYNQVMIGLRQLVAGAMSDVHAEAERPSL